MNEIKYEPLYGLQKPFDNGPADSTAYGLFRDGDEYIYYKIDKTSVYCFDTDNQWSHIDGAPTIPFLAMRRIIAEPKRWTWEDQKAGRLPEVGSEVILRTSGEIATINAANKNMVCLTFSDGGFSPFNVERIDPIETPEDRAKREEDEFVSLVEFEYNKMPNEISFRAGIRAAYRKLKGGE